MSGTALDPTAILMADALGISVYSVDYSLSPENPYPVALEEILRVYQAITLQNSPDKTVVFGVSAGGNLILSTLLKASLNGLSMPRAEDAGRVCP